MATKLPIEAPQSGNGDQENTGQALTPARSDEIAPIVGAHATMGPSNGNPVGKSAGKTVSGRPFQQGYDPRRGHGPAPGALNAGRPPDEFYEWLETLVRNPKHRARVEALLEHSPPDQFLKTWVWAVERLRGKPTQALEHSGATTVILRAVRE